MGWLAVVLTALWVVAFLANIQWNEGRPSRFFPILALLIVAAFGIVSI